MKRIIKILSLVMVVVLSSCAHKDLCVDHNAHSHKFHINVIADYRMDWEENYGGPDWKSSWPAGYMDYESLRPTKPTGIRVVNHSLEGVSDKHNIGADGGIVNLFEGYNDVLFYNNNTEYILFSHVDKVASTRATTRTRTRATFVSSNNEETMTPPDMLYANFYEGLYVEKQENPLDVEVTMQPLVFTYKVRYEFKEGLQWVALARGALSGMARSVLLHNGATSEDGATILYDCEVTEYGARALVNSFGIPGHPNYNYPSRGDGDNKHILTLEVLLRNGSLVTREFDVTDQVKAQPHGGVIVVDGIEVEEEEGTQGSGAFDVTVNGWGDYKDVVLDDFL